MLLKTAAEADPPLLVLDLSNLRFFGSGFIEALFRAWSVLDACPGGRMSLCGLTAYCREVVEITHLDQLWRVFDSRTKRCDSSAKVDVRVDCVRPCWDAWRLDESRRDASNSI